MRWWWQEQSESPANSQQAIEELAASLEHSSEDRQRKAAQQLAAVGHPLAVCWSLKNLTKRDCAEWSVRLLEQIVNDFTEVLGTESLREIAALADPLQKIPPAQVTRNGKPLPVTWETYRAIDCSNLRQKAAAELENRAKAQSPWGRTDASASLQPCAIHG